MDYARTVAYLYSQLPLYQRIGAAAYKADLENAWKLDAYFSFPHKTFKIIHVAGTNGKGSVSHMLASVLQQAGYKTGLYTSPHLLDFRERIRVNGEMVSKDFVVSFVDEHRLFFEKLKCSFFEMSVFMAFEYFRSQYVDVAVLEVGLGGRLDTTNIITPVLSVITNIGHDHTRFLGDTLGEIASEKAGIIKPNVPVVVGERHVETEEVFLHEAGDKGCNIYFAGDDYHVEYATRTIEEKQVVYLSTKNGRKLSFEIDLPGMYQQKNLITTLKSIEILKNSFVIQDDDMREGLRNVVNFTGLKGRWQIIGHHPLLVCDTAHNPEGIAEVVRQLNATPWRNLHIVFGMVNDKDERRILELLPPEAAYYFTRANIPRAMDANELKEKAGEFGLKGEVIPSVKVAVVKAKSKATPDDLIFIGGSTFVVAEVLGGGVNIFGCKDMF
ncbi:MAG: bifunctional folylpolyglutamate synthase/dihydrofolate synthase [Bacteroidota bacterium]